MHLVYNHAHTVHSNILKNFFHKNASVLCDENPAIFRFFGHRSNVTAFKNKSLSQHLPWLVVVSSCH